LSPVVAEGMKDGGGWARSYNGLEKNLAEKESKERGLCNQKLIKGHSKRQRRRGKNKERGSQ